MWSHPLALWLFDVFSPFFLQGYLDSIRRRDIEALYIWDVPLCNWHHAYFFWIRDIFFSFFRDTLTRSGDLDWRRYMYLRFMPLNGWCVFIILIFTHLLLVQGYLDSIRRRGFEALYIWVMPPNDLHHDYIFHMRPISQHCPKPCQVCCMVCSSVCCRVCCRIISGFFAKNDVQL